MKTRIAAPLLLTALAAPAFASDYMDSARVPIEVGVSGNATQAAYAGPPVERITYERHRVPVWEQRPYRRPRPDRDWDR
jgi:hypothetical protein